MKVNEESKMVKQQQLIVALCACQTPVWSDVLFLDLLLFEYLAEVQDYLSRQPIALLI